MNRKKGTADSLNIYTGGPCAAQLKTLKARQTSVPSRALARLFLLLAMLLSSFATPLLAAQRPEAPLATGAVMQYRGVIKRLQSGSILLTLDDTRPLLVKTSGKTKYLQSGAPIKPSQLRLGDWLMVEAALDPFSQLQAVTITLLPAAESEALSNQSSVSSPSSVVNNDLWEGNGRYTLRRGPQSTSGSQPPEGFDPGFLIERARIAAASFAGALPNFIAQETMSRYRSGGRSVGWQLDDTITVEVVYEDGQERYRNVRINDAPTNRKMEDVGGSWSTGEFASTLNSLLDERTEANFTWAAQATEKRGTNEFRTAVYNFAVSEQNSRWHVASTDQSSIGSKVEREIMPAYRGSVWIDLESARVLRIEMAATSLPFDYPLNAVESAVDYAMVPIGDQTTLLPTRAESVACQRGTNNCSRNVIDFRRYKKFTADTTIDFGAVEDDPK